MNWENGHICVEHWSSRMRQNSLDLPDVPAPPSQLKRFEYLCEEREGTCKKPICKKQRKTQKIRKEV